MKKIITLGLILTIAASFVGCGENKPTEEEVLTSIEAGTLTMEDALEKGYVDEQWIENYYAENSVPMVSKSESNLFLDFETKTLDGQIFTQKDLEPVTFIAFLNPTSQDAKDQYKVLQESYDDVVSNGADILVINISEEESELFADAKFEVVGYNESIKEAMGTLVEMVKEDGFIGAWNVNGAFLSSWSTVIEGDGFIETGKSMVEMFHEPEQENITMEPMA